MRRTRGRWRDVRVADPLGALEGLPEAAQEAPGVFDAWSVQDVVAHLASDEPALVDLPERIADGGPTPSLDRFREQGPAFNDAEVVAWWGRAPDVAPAERGMYTG